MRDDQERLLDILEAIDKVDEYAIQGRHVFEQERLIQVWIVHHIQIIGEAARKLSEEFKLEHNNVPWAQIVGMRNILVHDYFGIDLDEVWSAVEKDLPVLKKQIRLLIER